jgi:hypothetical protein
MIVCHEVTAEGGAPVKECVYVEVPDHAPSGGLSDPTRGVPLGGRDLDTFTEARLKLIDFSKGGVPQPCLDLLKSLKISPSDVVSALNAIQPYNGGKSDVPSSILGLSDPKRPRVSSYFGLFGGVRALTNLFPNGKYVGKGAGSVDVYFKTGLNDGLNTREIFHEAIHIATGDHDLKIADTLELDYEEDDVLSASNAISDALKKAGCIP